MSENELPRGKIPANSEIVRIANLEAENKDLREAITNYKSLVESLDKYVGVLSHEIEMMLGIAFVHGWKSKQVEEGIAIRELIDRARKLLETPTK